MVSKFTNVLADEHFSKNYTFCVHIIYILYWESVAFNNNETDNNDNDSNNNKRTIFAQRTL